MDAGEGSLYTRAVAEQLTSRQRDVFIAVVVHQVPIDVLADRQSSTRGAIYKTLYDARRKLRAELIAQGWSGADGGGEVG